MRIAFYWCMYLSSLRFTIPATNYVCESHVGVQVSEDGFA